MPLGNFGKGIKDALVGTMKGAGDVVGTTLDTARENTVKALQGVRDIGSEASVPGSRWRYWSRPGRQRGGGKRRLGGQGGRHRHHPGSG